LLIHSLDVDKRVRKTLLNFLFGLDIGELKKLVKDINLIIKRKRMLVLTGEIRKKSTREFKKKDGTQGKSFEFLILDQQDDYPTKVDVSNDTFVKFTEKENIEIAVRCLVVGGDKPFIKFFEAN